MATSKKQLHFGENGQLVTPLKPLLASGVGPRTLMYEMIERKYQGPEFGQLAGHDIALTRKFLAKVELNRNNHTRQSRGMVIFKSAIPSAPLPGSSFAAFLLFRHRPAAPAGP